MDWHGLTDVAEAGLVLALAELGLLTEAVALAELGLLIEVEPPALNSFFALGRSCVADRGLANFGLAPPPDDADPGLRRQLEEDDRWKKIGSGIDISSSNEEASGSPPPLKLQGAVLAERGRGLKRSVAAVLLPDSGRGRLLHPPPAEGVAASEATLHSLSTSSCSSSMIWPSEGTASLIRLDSSSPWSESMMTSKNSSFLRSPKSPPRVP